MVTQSLSNSIE